MQSTIDIQLTLKIVFIKKQPLIQILNAKNLIVLDSGEGLVLLTQIFVRVTILRVPIPVNY